MNYIKDILKEKNLTVNDLAVKLGISRQALSKQIQGKMLVETAERIAVALEVPLWRLFASREDMGNLTEDRFVAFFHYRGKSHLPTTVDEIMSILKDWREEEFHKECHRRDFDHMREKYKDVETIQKLMDSLSALLGYPLENSNNNNTEQ